MAARGDSAAYVSRFDPAVRLANRMLEREAWARERLAAFSGRTVLVRIGLLRARYRIGDLGLIETAADATADPDLTLSIWPLTLPSLLANPQRWSEFVVETGDERLGGTLKDLAQTLPWFVEQGFARALGPILGVRVAETGRRLLGFPEYAAQRLTENVVSYARDEARLLARGDEMRAFTEHVTDVEERTATLEMRCDALASREANSLNKREREVRAAT